MSKCPLYMHAIPPPGLFSLHLSMTLYPSPEMLASSVLGLDLFESKFQ